MDLSAVGAVILKSGSYQAFEAEVQKRLANEGIDNVVQDLGSRLPAEVTSLLRTTANTSQPFEEASIDKARKILNGMIESAQVQLDKKVIECEEFYERTRGLEEQIRTDLARL